MLISKLWFYLKLSLFLCANFNCFLQYDLSLLLLGILFMLHRRPCLQRVRSLIRAYVSTLENGILSPHKNRKTAQF